MSIAHKSCTIDTWSPFLVLLVALYLLLPGKVMAAAPELTTGISAAVSSSPYKGYKAQWQALPMVSFESERFYIRGYTAGMKVLNFPHVEWSVFAGYDDTSFKHNASSDRQLRQLEDRSASGILGSELRIISPYGMFHISGTGDVLGHSNGLSGDIGVMQSIEFGPLELIPAAGFHWSDTRYNDYYFGLGSSEAFKSGLKEYKPDKSFSPYLGITIDYSLTDQLEWLLEGEVTFLGNPIRNSPMVDMTCTQSLTMALTYTF